MEVERPFCSRIRGTYSVVNGVVLQAGISVAGEVQAVFLFSPAKIGGVANIIPCLLKFPKKWDVEIMPSEINLLSLPSSVFQFAGCAAIRVYGK